MTVFETSELILYLLEAIELVSRWLHVIAAALWIGASFYIISWENKFNRINLRHGTAGNFWTIQGGDFYYVEKMQAAPQQVPEQLHWFKYEAYLTWVSGFALLCLVYYLNPRSLVDSTSTGISPSSAIAISLFSLMATWFAYNVYCKTAWAKNLRISALVGLVFISTLAYLFVQIFTPQAAFIHVGAVLGTIMSANVFLEIIPWHKRFIKAIENNEPLEELHSTQPGFRSRHNHYMTVPVFFIMLSAHFPLITGHKYNWVLLPIIATASVLVKEYHSRLQQKRGGAIFLGTGLILFTLAMVGAALTRVVSGECETPVTDQQAFEIVATHCTSCHSSAPTDKVWTVPPMGLVFDTLRDISLAKERIMDRAVTTHNMPTANQTDMTNNERKLLGCWIRSDGDDV